jgi:type VI secretion system protein ImpH
MASASGHATNDLIKLLEQEPFQFDFCRAVRLLENLYGDLPPVGYSLSPAQDGLRFGQNPSLAFAPSTIESFQPGGEQRPPRMFVRFIGLCGPNGPMPFHFTEYVQQRKYHFNDPTTAAFLDVFHHRMTSFFYRAWASNQKTVDVDRSEHKDRQWRQLYAVFIGSFFGIGMETLRDRDAVPDWSKLYFSGRLACQTRHAEGLEAIVEDFFQIKTKVQTFIGQWIHLPPDSICRLGESTQTGSLGVNTIVGSRFWECQMKFRIRMGPMGLADYERMLPDGDSYKRLGSWVLNYTGQQLQWETQLVLKAPEVPAIQLGMAGKLGWTTWLKTEPFSRDADDLVLSCN